MALGMGAAGHRMETKLRALKRVGFEAVEVRLAFSPASLERSTSGADLLPATRRKKQIFYPCLVAESLSHPGPTPHDQLCAAAKATRAWCDELGLEVICLQPLLNYEGIRDEGEKRERIEDAKRRFEVRPVPSTLSHASLRRGEGRFEPERRGVPTIETL